MSRMCSARILHAYSFCLHRCMTNWLKILSCLRIWLSYSIAFNLVYACMTCSHVFRGCLTRVVSCTCYVQVRLPGCAHINIWGFFLCGSQDLLAHADLFFTSGARIVFATQFILFARVGQFSRVLIGEVFIRIFIFVRQWI